jgi:hypothetical protein
MEKSGNDNDTSSTSTQEPGEGREAEGDAQEGLDQPLADEHVHTDEQRNQQWTTGASREVDEPLREDSQPAPTLDMPQELEDKLDDIEAHPDSDAQEGTGGAEQAGGDEAGER